MSTYYWENHLPQNPGKTEIYSFHLKIREANQELSVNWDGMSHQLTVYLGVTSKDHILSHKKHIQKTRAKVSTKNSPVRQLTKSKWGADPSTLCATGDSIPLPKQANDNSLHEHSAPRDVQLQK